MHLACIVKLNSRQGIFRLFFEASDAIDNVNLMSLQISDNFTLLTLIVTFVLIYLIVNIKGAILIYH